MGQGKGRLERQVLVVSEHVLAGWEFSSLEERDGAFVELTDRLLRRVGQDCLLSFESSRYSIPAAEATAGMTVELRVGPDTVAIHAIGGDPGAARPTPACPTPRE